MQINDHINVSIWFYAATKLQGRRLPASAHVQSEFRVGLEKKSPTPCHGSRTCMDGMVRIHSASSHSNGCSLHSKVGLQRLPPAQRVIQMTEFAAVSLQQRRPDRRGRQQQSGREGKQTEGGRYRGGRYRGGRLSVCSAWRVGRLSANRYPAAVPPRRDGAGTPRRSVVLDGHVAAKPTHPHRSAAGNAPMQTQTPSAAAPTAQCRRDRSQAACMSRNTNAAHAKRRYLYLRAEIMREILSVAV